MINKEILKMQLKAIVASVKKYTLEPNIKGISENALKSIEKGDLELFIYCCNEIKEWYERNINAIYSSDFVYDKSGHDKSRKNIEGIIKDLNECKDEYIIFFEENKIIFEENKIIKKYELPTGEFNKVFIVHGRDNEAKLEVARYLEKLGLEAIILHEQASKGDTIIEKIEKYTDVGYAIILYTPCDIGKLKSEDGDGKFRARQNVLFEHGYLVGKIGRERAAALVKGDIELPNDISGVVHMDMDTAGAWKINIAKEMKAVGYSIDMNKLF
ncbi:putative nucleotide-binding containing TIR-like domain protein [Clostridium argentinense CDC 2741]|uniref:CD-NTase-associated protein 12/Pycsar effector protein TIR domain-containing protein n=2 Tax=Clostridium argentinense TaxID=29341 RepID=A0A7I6N2S5_9CLOT|nr:nucleotide-binding protein [Clostridium argentinense]ARC83165.1 hypothetical protein RSJ17_00510 [Clostridium argentinense]KIE45118.1 putative nucleotide-binding containing TIR-like domain protein [Clostridium argentinense CDC 2741]NFF41408.1 hypothetical protein [Clostridium argentinense]NFP52072.1 hypothetical protein [Clostridium argentinense]NFP74432.1 hypothetical protein [Clostridium argentinense]